MPETEKKQYKKKPTPPPVDKKLYAKAIGSDSGNPEKDKKLA